MHLHPDGFFAWSSTETDPVIPEGCIRLGGLQRSFEVEAAGEASWVCGLNACCMSASEGLQSPAICPTNGGCGLNGLPEGHVSIPGNLSSDTASVGVGRLTGFGVAPSAPGAPALPFTTEATMSFTRPLNSLKPPQPASR